MSPKKLRTMRQLIADYRKTKPRDAIEAMQKRAFFTGQVLPQRLKGAPPGCM